MKKVLLITLPLLLIIGCSDPFETGKKYYEKEDWLGAIEELSTVSTEDENYNEAQKLLLVAKKNKIREEAKEDFDVAKIEFEGKRWNNVVNLLSSFPKDHSLTREANQLLTDARFYEANKQLKEENWDKVSKLLSGFPKNHRLFGKANSILTKVTGRKVQQKFTDKWQSLKNLNDKPGGENHLKKNRSEVVEWYGIVNNIYTDYVELKYKGIEYMLYSSLMKFPYEVSDFIDVPVTISSSESNIDNSSKQNNMTSLIKGDKVYFTGKLIGEISLTLGGMLSAPEMRVKCFKITSVDDKTIYYEMTQKEIIAYKNAIKAAEKYAATSHKKVVAGSQSISNGTLRAYMYASYDINSEHCGKQVSEVAWTLLKKNPAVNRLELKYGLKYENRYGESKEEHIGIFIPDDISNIRRYKNYRDYESYDYDAQGIGVKFYYKGFQ